MTRNTINKDFDFSWRFHDFEIRVNHEDWQDKNSKIKRSYPLELIKYNDSTHKSCFSVTYWTLDDEGYDLVSVGSRMFEHISPDEIAEVWKQLQAAQKMLDAFFEANEEEY